MLLQYLFTKLGIVAVVGVQRMLRTAGDSVMRGLQGISTVTRCIEALADRLEVPDSSDQRAPEPTSDLNTRLNARVRNWLDERGDELVGRLDESVYETWLKQQGGLAALADIDPELAEALASQLTRQARATVVEAVGQLDLAAEITALATADDEGKALLRAWLEEAQPEVLEVGGARTYLLAAGPHTNPRSLQQLVEEESQGYCTVVPHTDASLGLICCGEQLSLANLASHLVHGQATAEISKRLHTRIDVDWKPMA